jgi:hypothetical protein
MSKKDRIRRLLADGKPHPSKELVPITHRFSDVIHRLREDGYCIETIALAHNDYAYQLINNA